MTIGVDKYALKNKILVNGSATKALRHKDYNLILLIPFFNNRYVKIDDLVKSQKSDLFTKVFCIAPLNLNHNLKH